MKKTRATTFRFTNIDASSFSDIVGKDAIKFIFDHAPRKVKTRVAKALHHYTSTIKLIGLDEEMGAIRLIAAEEELVVGIFELLKLKNENIAEHRDFVRRYKNHVVKLAFYPTLAQFRFIVSHMFIQGFTIEGMEDFLSWSVSPAIRGKSVELVIRDDGGAEIFQQNPLDVAISRDGYSDEEVNEALMQDFEKLVREQHDTNLRNFLTARADYRNKLLYASDAGAMEMQESLEELLPIFVQTYHDLLWTIAVLIGANPSREHWGLVSQFISLYRRALVEARILPGDRAGT